MVAYAFHHSCFIIDFIAIDNDSTIQDMLKHPSRGDGGQVMKLSKGKFDEEIPVPSLLADLSHRVKVVAKHIFSIAGDGKACRCGCTKIDSLRLKKCWGYTIKNTRNKSLD